MAQTTQNVSNLQINTVVHTKDANRKLREFKKLLGSFKNYKLPNLKASITGMTAKAKANSESMLKTQNKTVKALDRQVNSYNAIIQRQRKTLMLARKIKDVVGSTRPSGGGGSGSRGGGGRGSGGMGPNVPPGVRNNNRLNTTIDRSESLATSRGLDINARANGRSIRSLGRDFRNSGRSAAEYRHELRRVTAELRRGRINANGFGESMRRLRTYVVATTASMTLFAAGRDIVKTGLEIEGLEIALLAITGSAEKAAKEYQFFRATVDETAVDLIAATKGFKQITSAAKNTTLEGRHVHELFSEVSKQSTILGLSADETNGVFKAFQQIISKSKVSAEELSSQLGDRLPGAVRIAAEGMEMSTEKLLAFVATGKLTAEEFIPKMVKALKANNKGFKDALELSKRAAFTRFNNSLNDVRDTIFRGGLGEGLKDLANGFADILNISKPLGTFLGGTFNGVIVGITTPIALLVAGLVDIANTISRWAFGKEFAKLEHSDKQMISLTGTIFGVAIGLGVLLTALKLVISGFAMLKVFAVFSLLLNPITWLVAGLGLVVYSIYKIVESWHLVEETFNSSIEKIGSTFDDFMEKISQKWDSTIVDMKNAASEFADWIGAKFKDLLPEWAAHQIFGGTSGELPKPSRLSPPTKTEILNAGTLKDKTGGGLGPVMEVNQSGEVVIRVESMDDALKATATSSSPWLNIKNNTGR